MTAPEPILIGYMAKRVEKRPVWLPDWLKAAGVDEICSVSGCISGGLSDEAFDQRRHNALWLYDTDGIVQDFVRAEDDAENFSVFAYKLVPIVFAVGGERRAVTTDDLPKLSGAAPSPAPIPPDYEKLGYDSVQSIAGFGCSPLSCNGMASEIAVNRHCLIDTLDDAIAAARTFARDQPEPGDYYVVEVWRKRRGDANP